MKKADVKVGATYRAKVSSNVVEVRIDAESPHGGWDGTNLATGKKIRIKAAQRLRPNVGATAAPGAKDAAAGTTVAPEAKDATRANVGQRGGKRGKGHKVIRDGKVVHVTVPGTDETPPGPAATNPAMKATEKARKEAIKVADANLAAIEAAENGTKPKAGKGKAGSGRRSQPDFSKAAKPTFPKPKRTSAIDAAAQVLAKASEPMTCKAIVAAMAEQGLWSSPGGKTPEATLNAAIIRDIAKKRKQSRFLKAGRGLFAANPEGAER